MKALSKDRRKNFTTYEGNFNGIAKLKKKKDILRNEIYR